MTSKEAWSIVKSKIENVEPETANEIDKYYIFSLRPIGAQPGFSTGTAVIIINKSSGEMDSTIIGDPRLTQGASFKMIDTSIFKEES